MDWTRLDWARSDWAAAGELVVVAAAAVLLARIARSDFTTLKIRNRDLVLLLALLPLWLLAGARPALPHLAVGAALFAMTLLFWLAGKLGAGDVKLFGIAGAFAGPGGALLFSVTLLAGAILMLAIYRNSWLVLGTGAPWSARLVELVESRKVPYGVAISAALAVTMLAAVIR